MKMGLRAAALGALSGLGLAGLVGVSAQPASAANVRVRVVGIARDGSHVPVDATIYSLNDLPLFAQNGKAVSVPAGQHWIGAEVLTPGPGNSIASETLVMRRITIRRSETVLLDARPGRLVRFSLAAPGATDTSDNVAACLGGNFVTGPGVGAGGSAGTVYVVPVRSRRLLFGYGSSWQGPSAGYAISGQTSGGIPSRPVYHAALSSMAKLTIALRAGTTAGGYNNPWLQPDKTCAVGVGLGLNPATGDTVTEYATAGSWTTGVMGYRASWQDSRRYAAGRSYTNVFGGAVWGPGDEAPRAGGGAISYFPDSPFSDPAQSGGECCDKSSITLSFRGHVIKHQVLSEWRQVRVFTAHAPSAGWYTLRLKSWRWTPGLTIPGGLLSRQETLTWRFHAAPSSIPVGYQREVPAEVARFWPVGLSIDNLAPANGTTKLDISLVRTHDNGVPRAPRYALKKVAVQASFDGGKTWQTLRVSRQGGRWLATVDDPATGYVALRSVVADTRGDSATQTIYQAYGIG